MFWLKIVWTALLSLNLLGCQKKENLSYKNTFSFNLSREIKNLDPLLTRGLNRNFLLFNLHRGLYYYDQNSSLRSHGAESCHFQTSKKLICKLKKLFWSDGTKITSFHYLNSYLQIVKIKDESFELIQNIESVTTPHKKEIVFHLKKPDPDFLHNLTDLYFVPRKENKTYASPYQQTFSGPYKFKLLNKSFLQIENNAFFDHQKRPLVTAVFIDDFQTSLNLYQTNNLSFLRGLETSQYQNFKTSFLRPLARLDGLFISPKVLPDLEMRKKLFSSLNFPELKKIFSSKGMPGCVPLTKSILKNKICYTFQKTLDAYKDFKPLQLDLTIPAIGTTDHIRMAEWVKSQWEKSPQIKINIQQLETKTFYQKVKDQKLQVYRKALPLSFLSCQKIKNLMSQQPEFLSLKLNTKLSCEVFFKAALKAYIWLPLGVVHIPHLHSKDYKGYYINELNQFGLENLTKKSESI